MAEIYFDYFTASEAGQYNFYRIPKALFTEEHFRGISCEAKILYGLMLDRMGLSIKNQWLDSEGRVYIIFTIEDVMNMLGCRSQKAVRLMKELDLSTGIGLIEKKRIGLGRPNIIYVKNFMTGTEGGGNKMMKDEYVGQSAGRLDCGLADAAEAVFEKHNLEIQEKVFNESGFIKESREKESVLIEAGYEDSMENADRQQEDTRMPVYQVSDDSFRVRKRLAGNDENICIKRIGEDILVPSYTGEIGDLNDRNRCAEKYEFADKNVQAMWLEVFDRQQGSRCVSKDAVQTENTAGQQMLFAGQPCAGGDMMQKEKAAEQQILSSEQLCGIKDAVQKEKAAEQQILHLEQPCISGSAVWTEKAVYEPEEPDLWYDEMQHSGVVPDEGAELWESNSNDINLSDIENNKNEMNKTEGCNQPYQSYQSYPSCFACQPERLDMEHAVSSLMELDKAVGSKAGALSGNSNPDSMAGRMEAFRAAIRDNISYASFQHRGNAEEVDELVELMADVMMLPDSCTMRIAGIERPVSLIKCCFMKLAYPHIEYVTDCMQKHTGRIRNIRAYLLTALYNSAMTISSYYQAEANYDLYGQ